VAPAAAAAAPVESDEASSTTTTSVACGSTAATHAAMTAASSRAGMTTRTSIAGAEGSGARNRREAQPMRARPASDTAVAGDTRIYGLYLRPMDGDEHVRDWADLHQADVPRGLVGGWLRGAAAVARPLARAGVSPNLVTIVALAVALAAVPLAGLTPAAACVAVTLSGLLDSLDGAVAVQAGRTTKVGFLLDSALDRIADAAFPAALAIAANGGTNGIAAGAGAWLAVAATAAAWWLEYVRARGSLAGVAGKPLITPGERPTRIILTAVGLGLPVLATAALWAHVVIVGGSSMYLFADSIRRLRRADRPAPTTGS
jgi:archaetidylinositol phosphate synthase